MMWQFIIDNKESIIPVLIAVLAWVFREILAPAIRHLVQNLPTKWHLDPATGQLILRGIDKVLEKRFGKTAMLMNAWTDPGPASELLAKEIAKHVEKKFCAKKGEE